MSCELSCNGPNLGPDGMTEPIYLFWILEDCILSCSPSWSPNDLEFLKFAHQFGESVAVPIPDQAALSSVNMAYTQSLAKNS